MAKEKEKRSLFDSWRIWATAFTWLAVCVSTAIAARKVESFVSNDPKFTLSAERRDAIIIQGVKYASRMQVARVFAVDLGRSIYLIPVAERRRRLLAIDWIQGAAVSRIWPNRLLVRITERTPVAFINVPLAESARASRLALIDAEGVFLDPPAKVRFNFPILRGVSEQHTEAARRVRVRAMQRLLEDLGTMAKDVSEINAASTDDMRIVAQVSGRTLELELGDGDFASRLKEFVSHYPEIQRKSPRATSFDLRMENNIIAKD
jgi:cell division protein FtsQ